MTKQPQFTPGPWEIKDKYTICGKDAVKDALMGNDPSICHICTVNGWLVSAEANAALISLAPKMLNFVSHFASANGEADLHLLDKYTAGHGTEIHNAAFELLAELDSRIAANKEAK